MTSDAPKLHFAMLTYGALEDTRRAVSSLAKHTPPGFLLHVIDNASSDATPSWLGNQQKPWLRHKLNASNRGVPGGRNDLIDFITPTAADHDWIVFIDNDLEFQEGWIQPFLDAIKQFPDARVLGKVGHFITVTETGRDLAPAASRTGHVDVVSGGFACFVRVDAAKAIGKFDEQLGQFWHEDDDYCVRAVQQGFDVIAVPDADIVHHEHASGVATPGLADGGSPRNLNYLANKWREAGYADSEGWIKRESGPFMVRSVRAALQQRSGRASPIGRCELADAITLIGQLNNQVDPVTWFDSNRQPIPPCIWPLLAMHCEHAVSLGDTGLARELADIETVLQRVSNTTLLRPMMRGPTAKNGDVAGHGVCRSEDFSSPEFVAVAKELGVSHLANDPHARCFNVWKMLALAATLRRHNMTRPGVRLLSVGAELDRVPEWLAEHGATVEQRSLTSPKHGHYDVIVFDHMLDPGRINSVLTAHANASTLVIITGKTALNGVPSTHSPQPYQIEHDLLARAGLRTLAPINLTIEDAVLEACATSENLKHRPMLSMLAGPQVTTAFLIASQLNPAASTNTTVLAPARPMAPPTHRIGIDLRTLAHSDSMARGIGKFTTQHLAALCDADPGLRVIGYTQHDSGSLPTALRRPQITTMSIDDYSPEQVDLIHIPDPMNMSFGFDSPTRVLRHQHTTATFHDLTPLHLYLDQWPQANRDGYLDRLHQLERGNCHLLTNSVFTAEDTLAHTSIPKERVTPILAGLHHDGGHPPTPEEIAAVHERLGINGPFVLHVGALDPHKNFHSALNAFLMTRATKPLQMVVVGSVDPGITQAAALCSKRNVPDVIFTGYLPRDLLNALYASATSLLFMSRAEGFGLPILEAMAKGCPVIASNATSHPEVAGDAAFLVDPDDQAGAADHIRQLLQNQALRREHQTRGRRQAASFTWRDTAQRTLTTWHAMLASNKHAPTFVG
ncbi:MAG: glycosyltransferase involved in cell wall biosynthesis/GT2 family glycosyltransferase [Planctomycetota bacterium]|jgi:glycosyltransferase involved in cell wall biosynthesis/GT2 family glycosyltransferase